MCSGGEIWAEPNTNQAQAQKTFFLHTCPYLEKPFREPGFPPQEHLPWIRKGAMQDSTLWTLSAPSECWPCFHTAQQRIHHLMAHIRCHSAYFVVLYVVSRRHNWFPYLCSSCLFLCVMAEERRLGCVRSKLRVGDIRLLVTIAFSHGNHGCIAIAIAAVWLVEEGV